jgi:hypothetical protein
LPLYSLFLSGVGINLHNPPANGKQGPIPEEIYQALLTNKKQENQEHADNIITPTRINREKYTFLKLNNHLSSKKWPRPLFKYRTKHKCHQKSNPSRETV